MAALQAEHFLTEHAAAEPEPEAEVVAAPAAEAVPELVAA